MSTIVLGCDSNSNNVSYQNTVAKGLENAGYKVEKLSIGPDPFANYDYGVGGKNPKGKIGIYLMAASLISVVDSYNCSPGFDYHYFVIRGDVSGLIKSQNDFDTKGVPKDWDRDYGKVAHYDEWAGKTYKQINELAKDKCKCVFASNANDAVNALLGALNGTSTDSSSDKGNDDEDEEWDDKDNFTPHKGKIMEIKPYKEISSVSFDKSYDSPTGTGKVELVYSSKDYRFIYKGVAMKLKLRRSCDAQWSATGLEEPDYDENEKFIKEHIPTKEFLKELGLPDFRKQGILINTIKDSSDTGSADSDGSSVTGSSVSTNSNSGSSSVARTSSSSNASSSSNKNVSSKGVTKKSLSKKYVNSLKPSEAEKLALKTNVYDMTTIKALRRRAMGLYW